MATPNYSSHSVFSLASHTAVLQVWDYTFGKNPGSFVSYCSVAGKNRLFYADRAGSWGCTVGRGYGRIGAGA